MTTQSTIKNIFLVFADYFIEKAEELGLSVENVVINQEDGGFCLDLVGDKEVLTAFVLNEYCAGLEDDEIQDIMAKIQDI